MALSRNYKRACDAWKKATQAWQEADRAFGKEHTISWKEYDKAKRQYEAAKERYNAAFEREHRRIVGPAEPSDHAVLVQVEQALESCFKSLERRRIQAELDLKVPQKDGPQLAKIRAALTAVKKLREKTA